MKKLLVLALSLISLNSFAGKNDWYLSKRTDAMTDVKTVSISKFSETATFGRKKDLIFVRMNCKTKTTEVFMSHYWIIAGYKWSYPQIRFDKTKAYQKKMNKSSAGKAIFVGLSDTKSFVKRMKKHNQLLFKFESGYSGNWKLTQFKLKGFTKAHKKMVKACK